RAPGPYDLPGGEADGDRQGERRGGRRGAHRGHEDHEPPDPQTDPGAVDVVDDGEAAAVDGAAAVLARRRAPPGGRRGTEVVVEVPTGGHARTGAEVVLRCRRALGGPAAEVGRGRHPVEVGSRGCGPTGAPPEVGSG